MLAYNFTLALRSLRERIQLTILMVLAIAIGIGLLITVQTMSYQGQKIPLAHKADSIFFVQADNRDIGAEPIVRQPYMTYLTYRDANNIINSDTPASEHTTVWKSDVILNSFDQDVRPFRSSTVVTNNNFFSMFEVPFQYGGAWSDSADSGAEPVVILTKESNDLLFGGKNSVGEQLRINALTVTVVGVLAEWNLSRRFYDESYRMGRKDTAFIPDTFAIKNNINRRERLDCLPQDREKQAAYRTYDVDGLINSECTFVRLWAELPNPNLADEYRQFLTQYVMSQKELGRFPREMNNYVTSLYTMVTLRDELFGSRNPLAYIAPLFFIVCLLNAIGILLAKFMRKSKEVSLRRALGAKKWVLMTQYLFEVLIVGVLGGILGTALAYLGLQGMLHVQVYQSDYAVTAQALSHAFSLDWVMISKSILTAMVSSVVIGLYPIWRVVNIAPASQLKSQ